jgi:hypothetical protein
LLRQLIGINAGRNLYGPCIGDDSCLLPGRGLRLDGSGRRCASSSRRGQDK